MTSNGKDGNIEEVVEDIISNLQFKKIKKVRDPHRKARAIYKTEDTDVGSYDEFRTHLTKYMKHHHKHAHKMDIDDDRATGMAIEMLNENYKGRLQQAFQDSKDGKLQEVLNFLAEQMQDQAENHYTMSQLHRIDPTDFDTHVRVAKTLKVKYKDLIKEPTKSSEELAQHYASLIRTHARTTDGLDQLYKKELKSHDGHGHHGANAHH